MSVEELPFSLGRADAGSLWLTNAPEADIHNDTVVRAQFVTRC